MKILTILFIALGVVVLLGVAFEAWSRHVAKRSREHFDKMPPDEQRKEQERLYKAHQ